MLYCPRCERDRDNHEFPKFMGGMRGKICKSCLHYLDKFPYDHPMQLKFNNAGFHKESAQQIENRRKMMELDAQYLPK
jgi:hypothetical protein